MKDGGLDYNKTVKANRLIYKNQVFRKIPIYYFLILLAIIGVGFIYDTYQKQLSGHITSKDYFAVILATILPILFILYESDMILNRGKLKEIKTNLIKNHARVKLLDASKNLNWSCSLNNEHFTILLSTSQTITLIYFPDDKIYFNSINFGWGGELGPSGFDDNYQALVDEYLKIEKE